MWVALPGGIIGNIRRQYVDTRTQANLSKLKSGQDIEIMTEDFSQIVKRRNRYGVLLLPFFSVPAI